MALLLTPLCRLAIMPHTSPLDYRPDCQRFRREEEASNAGSYRAEAEAEAEAAALAGPAGAVLGDVPFPPGMEGALDPALGLGSAIIIPADLKQAPPPLQLDPEHAIHVLAQRYQELCRRFGFARSYIARLYSDRLEREVVEAPVPPVQRCYPTPAGGGLTPD
ncbi:hypothetical protein JCGZ_03964 [Jatropha curcas]|uniref:Uncharacterized protein n=1 Tax=Jatropha curcas TaxID=180498 RepID=A0A067L8F3_JATCU|nr:hypothetical protein JCGZ_03964 [Jatropha curcas]